MKTLRTNRLTLAILSGGAFIAVATALTALAQTAPVLKIATAGTNQFAVTFTNASSGYNYEVWWTPVLGNTNYVWTMEPPGNPGQTNFLLENSGYPAVFFRGVLDIYSVPLWQQSNPNNPPSPILKVTIASPANGAVLQ
jgi:hypothetical protein